MKARDPTRFFLQQEKDNLDIPKENMEDFQNKLIDLKRCVVCRKQYDIYEHQPRIIVTCGHTFCTSCIFMMLRGTSVQCVMCLKLVKDLQNIEQLPVNHTIMKVLAKENNTPELLMFRQTPNKGLTEQKSNLNLRVMQKEQQNIEQELKTLQLSRQQQIIQPPQPPPNKYINSEAMSKFDQFLAQRENNENAEVQPQDEQTEQAFLQQVVQQEEVVDNFNKFNYCQYHSDRISHYFDLTHRQIGCRVCMEIMEQQTGNCQIIDLFDINDLEGFFKEIQGQETDNMLIQDINCEDEKEYAQVNANSFEI